MSELKPSTPFRPIKPDAPDNALTSLVGLLNNPLITGAVVPVEKEILTPSPVSDPAPVTAPPPARDIPTPLGRKLFFTGRLCSGKDYAAGKLGASIYGLADPIYSLAEYLLNIKINANEGKDAPGVRAFLQTAGQWGRAEVNAQYPHTPERAMFTMMVRSLANQNVFNFGGVDWRMFGLTSDLWLDGLISRVATDSTGKLVAVTNVRFPNEYKRLVADGFQAWHCVCSPQSWIARLAERKLKSDSPELADVSEQLATNLNADLTRKLSANKNGPRMRVVWSDSAVPPPSPRLYSLEEFVSLSGGPV